MHIRLTALFLAASLGCVTPYAPPEGTEQTARLGWFLARQESVGEVHGSGAIHFYDFGATCPKGIPPPFSSRYLGSLVSGSLRHSDETLLRADRALLVVAAVQQSSDWLRRSCAVEVWFRPVAGETYSLDHVSSLTGHECRVVLTHERSGLSVGSKPGEGCAQLLFPAGMRSERVECHALAQSMLERGLPRFADEIRASCPGP